MDTLKNPKTMKIRGLGFSHNEIEKWLVQSEAE